jgi:hypothetical protein
VGTLSLFEQSSRELGNLALTLMLSHSLRDPAPVRI